MTVLNTAAGIGYPRAARLMDMVEAEALVGAVGDEQPRQSGRNRPELHRAASAPPVD